MSAASVARPVAVLLCGTVGAGKTTFARDLEREGYERLSIDEELWSRFGRYGVDYPPDLYDEYSHVAEHVLLERLRDLLAQRRDVVVDFGFWSRASRDRYKGEVERAGARWRLVHLDVPRETLLRRLAARSTRFDANAAFPVDAATLDGFLARFEAPADEGEEVERFRG
ncbi:AAA family ATPase [Kineococcus sp. TBRC 1896]|uniref:AAA family ATPase n=1 Tax=Kineococcus mangrovi TaxID=1660183 RepID=A0ABV4I653_9ACTN